MNSGSHTRFLFGFAMLALAAAIPVGCGTAQTRTIQVQGAPAELGVPSLEIHNFRGDVRVVVDPRRTEPEIRASFRNDSFVTKPTREEAFKAAPVVASYQQQAGGVVLRIETTPGLAQRESFSTDLVVLMPACAGVLIRTTDGVVIVTGASGPADITNNSSGKMRASITYRTQEPITDPVTLRTNNGDVFFSPGEGSSGRYALTTLTGRVRFSARFGDIRSVALSQANSWSGILNGGENPVNIHSDSGAVEVRLRKPSTRVAQYF